MKKVIIMVLVMVLLPLEVAFAFQNEPEGFRGLKWGDPPAEDMQVWRTTEYGKTEYTRGDEKMSMGQAQLEFVCYSFFRDEFEAVFLHFEGEANFELLETICREKFGKPFEERYDKLVWVSHKTGVSLEHSIIKRTGLLMIAYLPTLMISREAEKRNEAEEAEEDW